MLIAPVNNTSLSSTALFVKSNIASLASLLALGIIAMGAIEIKKCNGSNDDNCKEINRDQLVNIAVIPFSVNLFLFMVACVAAAVEMRQEAKYKHIAGIAKNITAYTGLCVGMIGISLMTRFLYFEVFS